MKKLFLLLVINFISVEAMDVVNAVRHLAWKKVKPDEYIGSLETKELYAAIKKQIQEQKISDLLKNPTFVENLGRLAERNYNAIFLLSEKMQNNKTSEVEKIFNEQQFVLPDYLALIAFKFIKENTTEKIKEAEEKIKDAEDTNKTLQSPMYERFAHLIKEPSKSNPTTSPTPPKPTRNTNSSDSDISVEDIPAPTGTFPDDTLIVNDN